MVVLLATAVLRCYLWPQSLTSAKTLSFLPVAFLAASFSAETCSSAMSRSLNWSEAGGVYVQGKPEFGVVGVDGGA